MALGERACGISTPIIEVAARMNKINGRGIILIDTMDLIVQTPMIPALQVILAELAISGSTIVFTCREQEYNDFFEPLHQKLPAIAPFFDRHNVPSFSDGEVIQAASAFIKTHPLIKSIDDGFEFAAKILQLAADNQSLQQITHNPLLLAMSCDLFARDGSVPRDLTVSRLYNEFWNLKVGKSRRYSPRSSEVIFKREICFSLAATLSELSIDRFVDSIHESDMPIDLTNLPASKAYDDLVSEGVLRISTSEKLSFFHQTFAEYAIARLWQTKLGAKSRRHAFRSFSKTTQCNLRVHFWHILRQYLALLEPEKFSNVIQGIDLKELATFRATAFAAGSREESSGLLTLLPLSLSLGEEYEETLLSAAAQAPTQISETAWKVAVEIMERAARRTAINAARVAANLLCRSCESLRLNIDTAIDAIERRVSTYQNDVSTVEQRSELLGWLLADPVERQVTLDVNSLEALRKRYIRFSDSARLSTIRLHLVPGVSELDRFSLLKTMINMPLHPPLQHEAEKLLRCLLPIAIGSPPNSIWGSWREALYKQMPIGWEEVQARSIGFAVAKDEGVIREIIQDLFHGDQAWIHRNLLAVLEAGKHGAYAVDRMVTYPTMRIPQQRIQAVSAFLKGISPHIDEHQRKKLVVWIQDTVSKYPDNLLQSFGVLANTSLPAHRVLWNAVSQLKGKQRGRQITRIIRVVPETMTVAFGMRIARLLANDEDRESLLALVSLYRVLAIGRPRVVTKLIKLASHRSERVSLAAAKGLFSLTSLPHGPGLSALIPLLKSHRVGLRLLAVKSLDSLTATRESLSAIDLDSLIEPLASERNDLVLQALFKLIVSWVRGRGYIPATTLNCLSTITARLAKTRLSGKTARSIIIALKVIAQTEDHANQSKLLPVVRELFCSLDLSKINDGESESIDLLSAIGRIDSSFLTSVLQYVQHLPIRNIRALAAAIRRVDGTHSPLLDSILSSTWCPQNVRSLILEFRGA